MLGAAKLARGRCGLLIALIVAIIATLWLAGETRSASPVATLPQLVADPPDNISLSVDSCNPPDPGCAGSARLLLRFNGYIHNVGPGALDMRGCRASTSVPMTAYQRIYFGGYPTSVSNNTPCDDGGVTGSVPPSTDQPSQAKFIFEPADGHNHWHLQNVARYSLWRADESAQVAPAMKVGFCLDDSEHVDSGVGPSGSVYADNALPSRQFCLQGQPDATDGLFEGISPGWRDVYESNLAFQYVDASDVLPGLYKLRSDVDPNNVIQQVSQTHTPAWSDATIPGYIANAVPAGPAVTGPQTITLSSQRFASAQEPGGTPGPVSYRLASPPAHGSVTISGSTATYTPSPGFAGADSFTYTAGDSTSQFPLHPATATVSVNVTAPAAPPPPPTPSIAIGGAPAAMVVGTSVQLTATVSGDSPNVSWYVDGIAGGNSTIGTITPGGLYTAPASVPAGGEVQIEARTAHGAVDLRLIQIEAAAPSSAAPIPVALSSHRVRILGKPVAARLGRRVIAAVSVDEAGTVRLRVEIGRKRIASCSAKSPANRVFTCRVAMPRHIPRRALIRIIASLRVDGRTIAVRERVYRKLPASAANWMAMASAAYWCSPGTPRR